MLTAGAYRRLVGLRITSSITARAPNRILCDGEVAIDQARKAFIWRELQAGRLRQGWDAGLSQVSAPGAMPIAPGKTSVLYPTATSRNGRWSSAGRPSSG